MESAVLLPESFYWEHRFRFLWAGEAVTEGNRGGFMEECLRVEGLCKSYGRKQVVKPMDFRVEQGQFFALLGPNGAGKSTVMNMIAALLAKTGGKIYVDGWDVEKEGFFYKKRIGMVFQEDVLDGDLTVYQNLLYRGGLYGEKEGALKERIQDLIKLLSLEGVTNQKYGKCSGGQKRLAQVARALLPAPRLLILDEPTTGMDPVTRKNVWETLWKLREKMNMTIFYTTHYLEEAKYADTLCILKEGNIAACGSLSCIRGEFYGKLKNPSLDEIYFRLLQGDA